MKYVKILGLLAVAAAAMMAFAASASATSITTTTGGAAATPTIHAVNEGHVTLQNPIANISCSSTVEGKVESHGSGVTAGGNISTLNFTSCTNSWHVTAITNGSLEVHWTSGHNGTLTSKGAKVDTTRFGVTCVYEIGAGTHIGTVTGGNPASLHIEASIPINDPESSDLCGTGNAKWEGNYVTTSALYVAP